MMPRERFSPVSRSNSRSGLCTVKLAVKGREYPVVNVTMRQRQERNKLMQMAQVEYENRKSRPVERRATDSSIVWGCFPA